MKFRQVSGAFGTSRFLLLSSLALGSIGVAIFCGYWFWFRSPSTKAKLPPLPQDESIKVFFNHDRSGEFTEPYRPWRVTA